MLSKIRLTKFQGFDQTMEFQLKPLTLVFGPNASGKSSIARALLLMKQSISIEKSFLSNSASGFLYDGPDISLASFANVVHQHHEDSEIEIGLEIDMAQGASSRPGTLAEFIESVDITFRIGSRPPMNGLQLKFGLFGGADSVELDFEFVGRGLKLRNWTGLDELFELSNRPEPSSPSDRLGADDLVEPGVWPGDDTRMPSGGSTQDTWGDVAQEVIFVLRNNFPSVMGAPWKQTLDSRKRLLLNDLLSTARIAMSREVRDIKHIGPLRTISERLIYEAGVVEDDFERPADFNRGKSSDLAVSSWLLALTDGRYKFQPVEFYAEPVKFLGSLKSQILVDTASNTPVTFADVGVGLSQVLPILQAMQNSSKKSSTASLLIEQPELHLHPAMQANLADLFIESVKTNPKFQIIAETHSESMLMRIQKRMREGKIGPDMVQILYVDRGTSGNQVRELELSAEDEFSISMPVSFSKLRLEDLL